VEIPQINFATAVLARTEAEVIDRVIVLDLTRFLKGRGLEARLKISKNNDRLIGNFFSLKLFSEYIRQMFRPGISYVEDSFVCTSKDGQKLRIKPFLITRRKVHRSVRNALRIKCQEFLKDYVKESLSEDIFFDVITGKLPRDAQKILKRVYPLSLCEIRVLEKVK
jgi:ribosomal protein S3AE